MLAVAAVVVLVVLSACTSSPGFQGGPATESELSAVERDPALVSRDESLAIIEAAEERERLLRESLGDDPDVGTVEPDCVDAEAPAGDGETVSVCFVAFGDATLDGSGPDQAVEGARIDVLDEDSMMQWYLDIDRDLREGITRVPLGHGETLWSTAESAACAPVSSVVTGADGTAAAAVKRGEFYEFCAVHPDDGDLIAGCSLFDLHDPCCFPFIPDQNKVGYWGGGEDGIVFREPLVVYVYLSRGRAFFGVDGGRYARFVAGETHPEGTGKVTFTGYLHGSEYFDTMRELPILRDQDNFGHYVIVEDADIGEFWEAARGGWRPGEVSQLSRPADEPATLVRTGPDGTAIRELPAGDYLFCAVRLFDDGVVGRVYPCTYEDVTAGQDRMIYTWSMQGLGFLNELNELSSAQIREEMATCNPSGEPHWCATEEQWQQARQHYEETGEVPDGWPDP